jgi:SAM-dependent methyltransferase
LPFSDATFENSLSLLVFNFIPDRKTALREVGRVTKPGGWVSAAVWDYGAGMRMLRVFWDAAGTVDPTAQRFDELHMPLCRAGELGELWKQSGLERVEERPLDITMRFESFADYWDPFLLGQGPAGAYLRTVEGDRRQALRSEVKRQLALTAEDAPFSIPARAWAVRGIVQSRR